MEVITQVNLVNQMFKNIELFESKDEEKDYQIKLCDDYDNMNLYICQKQLNNKINRFNFIKQLSKLEIRNSLFDSYFEITKINDIKDNVWTEKIIYNKKNYNIQKFILNDSSLLCYSDLELDDDSYDYIWINNPFTRIVIDSNNTIILNVAFEVTNQFQSEILSTFLSCLTKLELALISN